ncbi:MAG TPA: molybdopterin cofactor-binding domain-containing protein [Candidatus Acidoferrum sp.]|jgi:isoquinoline 1-oxidoreductase beta subunit|nr:molybdopterin cofactor-binding domain-containing protein [Candidatus Acidoferrum sp.]
MSAIQNVSRRGFLKGAASAGAFVLCVRILPESLHAEGLPENARVDRAALHPSVYVGIDTDGTVNIIAHRSEMGTTSRTSVPMILADELEADWKRVKLEQAIGDERYGSQNTDGSHSVREFYEPMRQAGATARMMLTQAAANQWAVPVTECKADLHFIVHSPTGRRLGYGELASAAAKLPVPKVAELKFKPKSAWRYIGKGSPSYDLADIVTGKAIYGMDGRMDGMVYASIERPPVLGGKVKSFDDKEALKVAGVTQTVPIDPFQGPWEFQPLGGVAVIAKNTWAAFQGRKSLKIDWDNGPNATYNSDQYKKQLQETARNSAKIVRDHGDVDASFAKGGKIIEAEYYVPHLAHAAMEPLVAVADFRDGKVTAWAPTQNPQAVQDTVAKAVGIAKENVICHVTLLGGGFGRKSKPDYVAEAAILSKKVGRPVKVVWTREDDIHFDFYHSVAAMYMKAAVDANGKPTAWLQRSVFPPIGSMGDPKLNYGGDFELGMGFTDMPFDVPNLRVENGPATAQVRIGWLRSVANIYHAFAVQTFADELAHAAGRDPVDYMLELIGPPRVVDMTNVKNPNYGGNYDVYPNDTGRLRKVLEIAVEKSGSGKRKFAKGAGIGIAVHRSFLTYVANVVEVEITDDGRVHIPRVETVVDAGLITNPEAARAQFEGAAVFGTSIALSGAITATNGAIDQSNFDSYPVARMREAPLQTNVHLVESDAPAAGIGEPGVPPFVPALCNAIFAATGKRVRELPLSKSKLA